MKSTRVIAALLMVFGVTVLAQQRIGRGGSAGSFENSITGRVTDDHGQPVAGAYVTLLYGRPNIYGQTRLGIYIAGFGTTTGAAGQYKLENLRGNDYYVVALPPINNRPASKAGFRLTYFPSSADEKNAKTVTVVPQKSVTADITLIPATLATVTGVVLGEDGQIVSGGVLRIAHGDGLFGEASMAASIPGAGRFVIQGMPPGTYFLNYNESGPRPTPGKEWQPSWETVVVNGRDVTDVRVAPVHATRITGRLIVDDETRKAMTPGNARVAAAPFDVSHDGNPGPVPSPVLHDDLTFEIYGWPPRVMPRVFFDNVEVRLSAARLNAKNVLETGIEVVKGQPISGLEIEASIKNRVR